MTNVAPYNHGQECKRLGIPYRAWCCEACAARAGAAFEGIGFETGGWCQVGKHRAEGRTTWLEIDPDYVSAWKPGEDAVAYVAAMKRYNAEPETIRNIIDAQYNTEPGHPQPKRWFAECVSLVLDI